MKIQERIRIAYDTGARHYASTWHEPHKWLERERTEFLVRVGASNHVVDIGCGPGHDTAWFCQHGLKCVGIDLSPEMITLARARYPDCEFVELDFFELGNLGRVFQGVWAAYSLLHVPPPDLPVLLETLRKSMSAGATLFVGMPIAEATEWTKASIAGLKSNDGEDIAVACAHWNLDALKNDISSFFALDSITESSPLPGRRGVIALFATAK